MNIRRDKRDKLFSDLVRERAEWRCERCGKYFPEGHRQGLECSHLFTRARKSGRWHPVAAVAHCTGCHSYLGGNPLEFAAWIESRLSPKDYLLLTTLAGKIVRLKKHDLADIHANLKASWQNMQARREAGETGRIEFDDPYPDHLT